MPTFSVSTLEKRQKKLSQTWSSALHDDDLVLIFAGQPVTKPGGLDQSYEFIPHPCYFWLTGERKPLAVLTYSKTAGWIEYRKIPSRIEKIWDSISDSENPSWPVKNIEDFLSFLEKSSFKRIFLFGEIPPSFQHYPLKAEILRPSHATNDHWHVRALFDDVRRKKDSDEVALVRKIALQAKAGYEKVKSLKRTGMTERQIQIEYEAETFRAGSKRTPYHSIVGAGPNAAILHAKPSNKIVQPTDIILIDAGADVDDYCVDITRVFPALEEWNPQQKMLVDLVRQTQEECFKILKPGVAWKDIHIQSARTIAEGLRSFGVLKCSADEALESGAMALFYPHGVGHMVGLRVRDVGYEQNLNPKKYFGVAIRVDFDLQQDYMMTVEPGCYFIEAYLKDDEIRQKFKGLMNFEEALKWTPLGGVRLEDDVIITANGYENLTDVVEKF